jgi:cysteinyl-tRNA synthetase
MNNEIAQSKALTGRPLARDWLHNGMVTVKGEKMSKSLGNFTTIRDLLEGEWAEYPQPVDPMTIRLFVLQAHYRKPLDFTRDTIFAAERSWQTLKEALNLDWRFLNLPTHTMTGQKLDIGAINQFQKAMDDDLNTAAGLAALFELAKSLRREFNLRYYQRSSELTNQKLQQRLHTLPHLSEILGITVQSQPITEPTIDVEWIESLIEQRHQVRQEKRYAESDRLCSELQRVGVTVVDYPDGEIKWHFS